MVLLAMVGVTAIATLLVGRSVADVLAEVPKDRLGTDPWTATLGVEKADPFQVAYLPDCAAGSVTRIVLWDEDSTPYWEVSGPPTPMTSFVVGGTPKGFTEVVPYEAPPRGALVRLVAFRRVGEPIGLRYRATQLVEGKVVATPNLSLFSREGFTTAEVCGDDAGDTTTATTEPEG
ncbi:MAG: hypothetical protein KF906_00795 [Actinobacteria bacterium]|nr:hypothetical protein [Actinomycetota bacterium]